VSSFSQDWIGFRADNHSYYQSTEKSLHCQIIRGLAIIHNRFITSITIPN
jgi:hypothetical protein